MQIIAGIIIVVAVIYFISKRKPSKTPGLPKINKSDEEGLFTVKTQNSANNTTQFSINLNEDELVRRAKKGTLFSGKNNRTQTMEDIAGFYGLQRYSSDNQYCIIYCDGHRENGKWKEGSLALIKDKTLLFKKEIERPNDCYVSDDGIVICCDWQNTDLLAGTFEIFNSTGEIIFSKSTTANLGACSISPDSNIALFETYSSDTDDSNQIFVVDVQQKRIIHQFDRPASFIKLIINTGNKRIELIDRRGFIFEIDYEGNQTNKEAYEMQIMTEGSVLDCLSLYGAKPDEIKLKDEKYLELLNKALTDKDTQNSLGKDSIYRMLGEYYASNSNTKNAIENWEKAIQINPKIGVKRKLDKLKREI